MSRTDTTPRSAALAVLLVVVALVVVPPSAGAAVADDTAERWSGYRIPETGRAAGGWIGAYRVGDTPVYVVTPGRRPNRAGFRRAKATDDLFGRKGATPRETERAAWVLSKYGGYKDPVQAAAVDTAVLHLLAGSAWQLGGARGARRVRASGDPATVRRFVRLMLRQSRASAGPYRASVSAASADVGGVTSVTVRVIDGGGGPVAGLPVSVTSPDGGPSSPAAGPVEAVTGDDGRAQVRLAAPLAGWRTVTAKVGQVPEHRLRVRRPDRRGQAAVVEGGVRRRLVASTLAAVRGPQTLALAAVPATINLGAPVAVAVAAHGAGTARGAAASLHGPFATAASATCSGSPVGSVSAILPGDGSHALPAVTPGAGGYYAWRVDVEGTATSLPATACGAVVKVRGRPTVSVAAPPSASVGDTVQVPVMIGDMPFPMRVDVTLKLYGPGDTTCSNAIEAYPMSRLGNGQVVSGSILLESAGAHRWKVEAAPGDLWQGAESVCGAPGSITQVS